VVDALTAARLPVSLGDLAALNSLLPEWQPEAELWQELLSARESDATPQGAFSWSRILAILGWDPHGAVCAHCNIRSRPARHFYIPRQEFFCAPCAASFARVSFGSRGASRFAANQLLLIDD
jgi:recombinational DNA repair protein (RecF pathway)